MLSFTTKDVAGWLMNVVSGSAAGVPLKRLENMAEGSSEKEPTLSFLEKRKFFCTEIERQYLRPEHYPILHKTSVEDPAVFWGTVARLLLSFDNDFHTAYSASFAPGGSRWFLGGYLNASFNCVDRHALENPGRLALLSEADEPGAQRQITYGELLERVSNFASLLQAYGAKCGDVITIYMPTIPEIVIAMLACARIGAIHSVVFLGFSAQALRQRLHDAQSKIVVTVNEGKRGGKTIPAKLIVDEALQECPLVSSVIVYRRTESTVPMQPQRDLWWHEEVKKYPKYMSPRPMASEDPLFLLYTSGSTGQPKGLVHSTAGYLVGAAATGRYTFNIKKSDRVFCTGDIGWAMGHTYAVYMSLSLGATTVLFEGTPTYPSCSRYWDIVKDFHVTHFCSAPTALRLLESVGDEYAPGDLTTLKVLATAGEPIAAETWKWYHDAVGEGRANVIDTYWQTESGGHLITPLSGVTTTKPGSASLPFLGIDPVILDLESGDEVVARGEKGMLAIRRPWPSMARTIWRSHQRFEDLYFDKVTGYYITGDEARRDEDGHYWIQGRADDVINVSGHRLSATEIESSILSNDSIVECAVVGVPDHIKGSSLATFASVKLCGSDVEGLKNEIKAMVKANIGSFAVPEFVFIVFELPKTRSGKITRRILRCLAAGEYSQVGDTSTLQNPEVVHQIANHLKQIR